MKSRATKPPSNVIPFRRRAQALAPQVSECDPLEMLDAMVDVYFRVMRQTVNAVKAKRKTPCPEK